MTKVLIIADTHFDSKQELHPAYQLAKKFAKYWKPKIFVHLGDVIDFSFISSFTEKQLKLLEDRSFKAEYDYANRELDWWQSQKYIKRYIIRQGNHDQRVDRVLLKMPAFEGLIEFEEKLKFKERGFEYYKEIEEPTKLGKQHLIHGWYHNTWHTKKHWQEWGASLMYGHLHCFQEYGVTQKCSHREYSVQAIACLTDKDPEWMKGRPTRWQHGFAVLYLRKNGDFNLYPIRIIRDQFIFEGKLFKL